ncbi:DUF2513 domain-containing protein [Pseudoalteromonas sp. MM17-2]|uniref:DUF2513 domain-containing protein n=1 Tax=Pseudoalteromonas sp. MM17-2 TaxID=2917753 RepID=UPI001EF51305|nr:DUF2513 domain-containing protein [Pseudoalteromonas sp. MM17-2]MCG7544108.1 DUF2513 domain-containing protein [Pseudoalteromonas sp. MM17-2]
MRRDWEIIRRILLEVEELEPTKSISLSNYPDEEQHIISYHVKLLYDAQLLEAIFSNSISKGPRYFTIQGQNGLTWNGHEFLDSIKDEGLWKDVKKTLKEKGKAMTFEVIKTTATTLVKSSINQLLGS